MQEQEHDNDTMKLLIILSSSEQQEEHLRRRIRSQLWSENGKTAACLRKYEAITGAGIKVMKRVDLPDDFIKAQGLLGCWCRWSMSGLDIAKRAPGVGGCCF